jgi:hypothetical protein
MNMVVERAQKMAIYAAAQEANREQLAQARFEAELARIKGIKPDKVTNYSTPLHDWWNSMPPPVRNHPWSIETIMAAAYPGKKPAPRCVAAALRAMGFTERRDWSNAGRNKRQWHSPDGNR